jgi:hypothetical protein
LETEEFLNSNNKRRSRPLNKHQVAPTKFMDTTDVSNISTTHQAIKKYKKLNLNVNFYIFIIFFIYLFLFNISS